MRSWWEPAAPPDLMITPPSSSPSSPPSLSPPAPAPEPPPPLATLGTAGRAEGPNLLLAGRDTRAGLGAGAPTAACGPRARAEAGAGPGAAGPALLPLARLLAFSGPEAGAFAGGLCFGGEGLRPPLPLDDEEEVEELDDEDGYLARAFFTGREGRKQRQGRGDQGA